MPEDDDMRFFIGRFPPSGDPTGYANYKTIEDAYAHLNMINIFVDPEGVAAGHYWIDGWEDDDDDWDDDA